MFYIRYLFFILGSTFLIQQNPKLLKLFFYSLIFSICFLFVDSFIQLLLEKNIFFIKAYSEERISSVMGDEAILGRYLAPISAITLTLYIYKFQIRVFYIFFIIIISLLVIVISGDRAPFLRYVLFLIGLIFIMPKDKKKYFFSLTVIFSIALTFIISIPQVKFRIISDTYDQITQTTPKFMPYSKHYEEHFLSAYKMGIDNFIFGQGPNTFEKKCGYEKFIVTFRSCTQHPHNFYWQLFAENGVIGLSFILIFYLYVMFRFFNLIIFSSKEIKKEKSYFFKCSTALMILCFLFPIIPNMSFYNNWNNIFLYIMISMLLFAWKFFKYK